VLLLDDYARLYKDGLTINSFGSLFEATIDWNSIASVTIAAEPTGEKGGWSRRFLVKSIDGKSVNLWESSAPLGPTTETLLETATQLRHHGVIINVEPLAADLVADERTRKMFAALCRP